MKHLLIALIALIASTSLQASQPTAGHIFTDTHVLVVMDQHNRITDTYEIDFSETCELEFDGFINEQGQCELAQ